MRAETFDAQIDNVLSPVPDSAGYEPFERDFARLEGDDSSSKSVTAAASSPASTTTPASCWAATTHTQ